MCNRKQKLWNGSIHFRMHSGINNVGINNTPPTELLDGNIKCTGTITTAGTINANGNKLNFPNILDQYKINLWGTNNYGFGIAASTLQYSSQGNHSFYNSSNNANTFTIDSVMMELEVLNFKIYYHY